MNSRAKSKLLDGFVVIMLMGEPLKLQWDALLNQDHAFKYVVLHVGLMYLNPWRPTFMICQRAEQPLGEPRADERRLYVQVP